MLVTVTVRGAETWPRVTLPKLEGATDDVAGDTAATAPLLLSLRASTPHPASAEVTVSVPATTPVVVGRKRTLMVQAAAAARVVPQVL